jgi:hypothetical protein
LSIFILLCKKLTGAICADQKEADIGQQMAMASNYNAQQQMECLTGNKQETKGK